MSKPLSGSACIFSMPRRSRSVALMLLRTVGTSGPWLSSLRRRCLSPVRHAAYDKPGAAQALAKTGIRQQIAGCVQAYCVATRVADGTPLHGRGRRGTRGIRRIAESAYVPVRIFGFSYSQARGL
jgi:hypothetical protein